MNLKSAFAGLALAVFSIHCHAVGQLADVSIYDRSENRVLPVYYHEGRYYIAGKPGNEYQITIRNQQSAEIMAVAAVDGVNVISGETAHWGQGGYVFAPAASYSISGWRKSLQRVARFFFTERDGSYAARTGRPDNVGVIGVALFRKKAEPAVSLGRVWEQRREMSRADNAPAAAESVAKNAADSGVADAAVRQPSAPAPAPEKNLGTGHGSSETSPVRTTTFERASSSPDEVITLYYDSYRNLLAQGVIRAPQLARPQPFPGQFVPDPR